MAGGRARSTRKLRAWMVEQVNSGKYPGVVWDDESKTMFRIPWKHAGKQDFRKDEDAALFKAWAEFKGKLNGEELNNPASWKTRLRCALNKSPEFSEVNDRAQLDISEPYKVYRLVPEGEQGVVLSPEKKSRGKVERRQKRSGSDTDEPPAKLIKTEIESPQSTQSSEEFFLPSEIPVQSEETVINHVPSPTEEMDEITLDVRIEGSVPSPQADQDSFRVVVQYLGLEVVRQTISGSDVRIKYQSSPHCPPCDITNFPRVTLPEPRLSPAQGEAELGAIERLLPFMDKGILLTILPQGVYGKRYCQGRVFWTGPHSAPGLHKMERNTDPVLLFSKDTFKQQLDQFCANQGERPQCSFTLCFGEFLEESEDPSKKLIIVQIELPWAEQQVENFETIVRSINYIQSLADKSPMREITLDLELVPPNED